MHLVVTSFICRHVIISFHVLTSYCSLFLCHWVVMCIFKPLFLFLKVVGTLSMMYGMPYFCGRSLLLQNKCMSLFLSIPVLSPSASGVCEYFLELICKEDFSEIIFPIYENRFFCHFVKMKWTSCYGIYIWFLVDGSVYLYTLGWILRDRYWHSNFSRCWLTPKYFLNSNDTSNI